MHGGVPGRDHDIRRAIGKNAIDERSVAGLIWRESPDALNDAGQKAWRRKLSVSLHLNGQAQFTNKGNTLNFMAPPVRSEVVAPGHV